jgi:hypothetical protein
VAVEVMKIMSRRYLLAGLGVLALAAALAIPAIAQPGWRAGGRWGRGLSAPSPALRGPVTIDTAVDRVREALANFGYTDLVPKEVMEFSNHFYVLVVEKSTGKGALELIVQRNGAVHPEPGPNMMWNTKYGHMAGAGWGMRGRGMMGQGAPGWGPGMMGPGGPGYGPGQGQAPFQGQVPAQTVTRQRARQLAAQFLAQTSPGATPDEGTEFYGYFTFDVERAGQIVGMLSVNAYTGRVWYHTWHGTFVREKEL